MSKSSPKKPPDSPKLEFEPDAWERFERLVKSAAKMGPRPRDASPAMAFPQRDIVINKRTPTGGHQPRA